MYFALNRPDFEQEMKRTSNWGALAPTLRHTYDNIHAYYIYLDFLPKAHLEHFFTEHCTNQEDVPCNKQLSEIMADDNTPASVTMAATSLSKISPWLVASENITPPTLLAKSKPETVTRKTRERKISENQP
uniref:Uncharacterized protein n=1 Tax=Timema shepardi TaxID=629360 RepID=A0A7R9AT46_TIMSH|nr:unnamed protein product [Timema shepardi]